MSVRRSGAPGLAATAVLVVVAACALSALPTRSLAAQLAPAFGGAELRAGVVFAERAVAGPGVVLEGDLGHFWRPELRVIAGLSRFSANINREPGGDEGSFTATGLWLGARYDLLARSTTGAYLRAAVTLQAVEADAWDSGVDALLSGTNTGAAIAVGVRRRLDAAGRLSGTLELRRTALNNIANTAVEIGLRYQHRGTAAYAPETVVARPLDEPLGRPVAGPEARTPERERAATDTAAARRSADDRRRADEAVAERAAGAAELEVREAAERRADEAERKAATEALLRQGLTRAAAAMRSVTDLRETEASLVVTMSGTAFPSGAATLSPSARGELRVLATVLAGYPGHIISVEGHTDAVGDARANQVLSVERASAVRAGLIAEGVDPLWVGVRGFGAERPVASNESAAGRAANRRVEIRVMKVPCPEPPRPAADGAPVCPVR